MSTKRFSINLRLLARAQPIVSRSIAVAAISAAFSAFAPTAAEASSNNHLLITGKATVPPSGATQLCQTYHWACTGGQDTGKISSQVVDVVAKVNRKVNRSVRYVTDQKQFNAADHWSLPTARGGDCEDFALLKKQKLVKMGFPPQSLLIATVLDKSRAGHAVLVVRTAKGDLILDNATDRILPWSETGYVFLRMQDPKAPKRWVSVSSS